MQKWKSGTFGHFRLSNNSFLPISINLRLILSFIKNMHKIKVPKCGWVGRWSGGRRRCVISPAGDWHVYDCYFLQSCKKLRCPRTNMKEDKGIVFLYSCSQIHLHYTIKEWTWSSEQWQRTPDSFYSIHELIVNSGAVLFLEYSRNFSLWGAWR